MLPEKQTNKKATNPSKQKNLAAMLKTILSSLQRTVNN